MQAAKGGPLRVVPTGAGEARQLTHDNVSYQRARWLAGGKELLASGFESGHGARDYLIAVSSGDAKPITPEGVVGVIPAPMGGERRCSERMEDGGFAAGWERVASDSRAGFELSSERMVAGWGIGACCSYAAARQDGECLSGERGYGKMQLVRTFGGDLAAGTVSMGGSYMSGDGGAYAYRYMQVLSQVYVVKG